jgi:hypothetical protein
MDNNIAKYNIKYLSCADKYKTYIIDGLKNIYHGQITNYKNLFNGASCLIRNKKYKGYCNLCIVYHSDESDIFDNGYSIHFAPLYDENGNIILIKYESDDIFVTVHCGRQNGPWEYNDAKLTFFINGTFDKF